MHQSIKKLMFCLAITTLLSINGIAVAKVKAVTGQLSLMATLNGKPAFRTVLWKLTPKTDSNNTTTIHVNKHAKTLDLAPGDYQVSVSLDNKTHTYQITIKENSKQTLIVDLS